MFPILIAILILASAAGWLFGEATNKQLVRIVSSLTCFILTVVSCSLAAGFFASINAGVPMTEAIHQYVENVRAELVAGNVDRVIQQMDGFEDRVHVTYEKGWFIEQLQEESDRLTASQH